MYVVEKVVTTSVEGVSGEFDSIRKSNSKYINGLSEGSIYIRKVFGRPFSYKNIFINVNLKQVIGNYTSHE